VRHAALEERGVRTRTLRSAGWVAVVVLASLPLWVQGAESARGQRSLGVRLLGPLATPIASAQWVRVDGAIRAGRTDLALSRAEIAFALDPGATDGWVFLARYLAFDLAAPERESDPARRLAWIRAALALAERGESSARDPGELALWRGLVLMRSARLDPQLDWPDGALGMWRDAVAAFDRAATLGSRDAAELAAAARESLLELEAAR